MNSQRLAVLVTVALASSHGGGRSPRSPFTLCVVDPEYGGEPTLAPAAILHALWASLGEADRAELVEALDESVSRRETRLNPFAEDLDDTPPDARLERLAGTAPRLFGTARALAQRRYCATDGFCVRVAANGCRESEREPRGREEGRARFLAWPLAHAERQTFADERSARVAAAEARRRADVALVVEGIADRSEAELAAFRAFRRRAVLVRLEQEDAAGDDAREALDAAGFVPQPNELLVVPTLQAVSAEIARSEP